MKQKIYLSTLFIVITTLLTTWQTVLSGTLVYSMKIRRVLAGTRQALNKEDQTIWALSFLPIGSGRTAHIVTKAPDVDVIQKRRIFGVLLNARCLLPSSTWLEFTTAVHNESGSTKGSINTCGERTGLDDIVASVGHNISLSKKVQLVFYGIAGAPTRQKITEQDRLGTFVGTRFFSLGGGAELSYTFVQSPERMVSSLTQTRFIHFFDRGWSPLLPCGSSIQPGDIIDALVATTWREKKDIFELGYNPTFFINQGVTTPERGEVRTPNFVRHGAYVSYSHLFTSRTHPILLGASFGFNKSDLFDACTYSGLINCTIIF